MVKQKEINWEKLKITLVSISLVSVTISAILPIWLGIYWWNFLMLGLSTIPFILAVLMGERP